MSADNFEQLVLENLRELKSSIEGLKKDDRNLADNHNLRFDKIKTELYIDLTNLRIDVAGIKIRSSIYGAVAGIIPVAIALSIAYFARV